MTFFALVVYHDWEVDFTDVVKAFPHTPYSREKPMRVKVPDFVTGKTPLRGYMVYRVMAMMHGMSDAGRAFYHFLVCITTSTGLTSRS